MVTITKHDDKYFMVVDDAPEVELEVKQPKGWEPTIMLPENPTGRKLINQASADKRLAETGSFELTVKHSTGATGSHGPAIPNKRLVEYLKTLDNGQALYDEYMAIIERAIQARDAAKSKPKTEKDKLMAKIEAAKKALAKLEAEAAGETVEEVEA